MSSKFGNSNEGKFSFKMGWRGFLLFLKILLLIISVQYYLPIHIMTLAAGHINDGAFIGHTSLRHWKVEYRWSLCCKKFCDIRQLLQGCNSLHNWFKQCLLCDFLQVWKIVLLLNSCVYVFMYVLLHFHANLADYIIYFPCILIHCWIEPLGWCKSRCTLFIIVFLLYAELVHGRNGRSLLTNHEIIANKTIVESSPW